MRVLTPQQSAPEATSSVAPSSDLMSNRLIRAMFFIMPTLAALGPVAAYPFGGSFPPYRLLFLPAAVVLFIMWHQNKRPFVGWRAMLVMIVLVATVGTILLLSTGSVGVEDHLLLIAGLLMAWLLAAAMSGSESLRNTILAGWIMAVLVTAFLTILNILGIFVPATRANELIVIYSAAGLGGVGYPGPLGNPNDLGAFAVCTAPLAYLAAKRLQRPWLVWLLAMSALLMVAASLSRMAALGAFLIPIAYLAVRRLKTPGRMPVLLITVGYFAVLAITILVAGGSRVFGRLPFIGEVYHQATEGWSYGDDLRRSTWAALLESSFTDYYLGAGPGQFEALTFDLGFALQTNAHNVFLEVLFEYGVLFGFAGLIWLVIVAVNAWKIAKSTTTDYENMVVAAGVASLLGLAMWGSVSSSLIDSSPWGLILGTGLGLVSSVWKTPHTPPLDAPPPTLKTMA